MMPKMGNFKPEKIHIVEIVPKYGSWHDA